MLTGTKFWPINVIGNYAPSANPSVEFYGNVVDGNPDITGLSASLIAALTVIGTANIGVLGLGIDPTIAVSAIGVDSITLSANFSTTQANGRFYYYDKRKPAAGIDGPIQAILCLDSTHGAFSFIDTGGRTVTIPGSTLAKGAIYYFQISEVTVVSTGDFIGYAGK